MRELTPTLSLYLKMKDCDAALNLFLWTRIKDFPVVEQRMAIQLRVFQKFAPENVVLITWFNIKNDSPLSNVKVLTSLMIMLDVG